MNLPNADRARIDPGKLHSYLLSNAHPIGRFKATFFAALGYTAENWSALSDALRAQHVTHDATLVETTSHGHKYEIRAMLTGPAGQSRLVVSAWIIRTGEQFPRFVTAYPGDEP